MCRRQAQSVTGSLRGGARRMQKGAQRAGVQVLLACLLLGFLGLVSCTRRTSEALLDRAERSAAQVAAKEAAPKPQPVKQSGESLAIPTLNVVSRELGGLKAGAPAPWIVALHGLGDRPEAFLHLFDALPLRVRVYAVEAPLPYAGGFDWFGVRVSAPEPVLAAAVTKAAQSLAALLERLSQEPVNQGKPIVTGFSQGGYLAFSMAALYPGALRAAFPIAGSLPLSLVPAGRPAPAPGEIRPWVVAFHGQADEVVPVTPTRDVVTRLRAAGYKVELKEYPTLAHQISAEERAAWVAALGTQLPADAAEK